MKIKISKFGDSQGILGKRVFLGEDGKLLKESVVSFARGWFESIDTTWDQFGNVITGLLPNETLGLGVCSKVFNGDTTPLSCGQIVTAKREAFSKKGACARTLTNFKWHESPCTYYNVIMFDIDDAVESVDSACSKLFEIYPELTKIAGGYWVMASAGAYIKRITGEWETQLSGLHIYFALPNTYKIDELKKYLRVRSWLAGQGYFKINIHAYGHSLLERHYIDMSVFSPERLDFIGGSACAEGLVQERPAPQWFPTIGEGEPDFQVDPLEEQYAEQLKSKARYEAEGKAPPPPESRQLLEFSQAVDKGHLPGMFPLQFDNAGAAYVWQVMLNPERYNQQTLADPLFPDKGRCKAKYYWNKEGDSSSRHVVNSFAKGGQVFFLKIDLEGALSMIQSLGESELQRLFGAGGVGWENMTDLDPETELPSFLDALRAKGVGKIAELKAHMGKAVSCELAAEKITILEQMNEKYAYVDLGQKPRILEDTGDKLLLRTRADFLTAVEDIHVRKWSNGKPKKAPAGIAWLEWDQRRKFAGVEFNPCEESRTFERNGKLYYNRFRGFTVQPKAERRCGRTHCKGLGCFNWFFGPGEHNLCPKGSWTYWLRTIFVAVADKNPVHARWVIDWLCEIIKSPGSGDQRPGTCLVLRGGQGTGKGCTVWPIYQLLGPHAFQCDTIKDITTNFNFFMEDTLLLFADEATWGGSKTESGKLKRLITEPQIAIEPKSVDKYLAKNFIRMFVSSNSQWVVPAEDDERRYTVFNMKPDFQQNIDWFLSLKAADLGELLDEIKNHWTITSNLSRNLETDALNEQKELGLGVVEEFIRDAMDEQWFWDEQGRGRNVSHLEVEQLFTEKYLRHPQARELTPGLFVRRLRKMLSRLPGDLIKKGEKVNVGSSWVYGFRMPSFDLCQTLIFKRGQPPTNDKENDNGSE